MMASICSSFLVGHSKINSALFSNQCGNEVLLYNKQKRIIPLKFWMEERSQNDFFWKLPSFFWLYNVKFLMTTKLSPLSLATQSYLLFTKHDKAIERLCKLPEQRRTLHRLALNQHFINQSCPFRWSLCRISSLTLALTRIRNHHSASPTHCSDGSSWMQHLLQPHCCFLHWRNTKFLSREFFFLNLL